MNNYKLTLCEQFKHCHATQTRRVNEETGDTVRVFYSYTCPKIVKTREGFFKFTFENSRKAGAITSSKTTSKQCNAWIGGDHHKLEKLPLKEFEDVFFDTRLEKYY